MFGADSRTGRGAMMRRSVQPTTAQVVTAVVNAPAPVDASHKRPITPAPDPSSRPRPIGGRGMRREPAGISIFGGRVYEQDAIAAQSIMPREIPGVVTDMPAPIGPPPTPQGMMPTPVGGGGSSVRAAPAWYEHAWRSIFGNRIDSQHLPPWDPNCPPAKVAAAVASPPAPEAVLPAPAAAQVKQHLHRMPPSQRAAAWRSIFGNLILRRRAAATGAPPPPAVVAAVQTAAATPSAAPAAMSGWHGRYLNFSGFGGLIGFGG